MTSLDLEHEQLVVLPLRLETLVLNCAPLTTTSQAAQAASQVSNVEQTNIGTQEGGLCIGSNCPQTNVQSNTANVNQQLAQVQDLKSKAVIRFGGDRWLCGVAG